jgi:hypothetical protein
MYLTADGRRRLAQHFSASFANLAKSKCPSFAAPAARPLRRRLSCETLRSSQFLLKAVKTDYRAEISVSKEISIFEDRLIYALVSSCILLSTERNAARLASRNGRKARYGASRIAFSLQHSCCYGISYVFCNKTSRRLIANLLGSLHVLCLALGRLLHIILQALFDRLRTTA